MVRHGDVEMDFYLPTEKYNALAEALANLEPCPVRGVITADQIKIVLGERADIWPASIAADKEAA
jgi:hypothetical protein